MTRLFTVNLNLSSGCSALSRSHLSFPDLVGAFMISSAFSGSRLRSLNLGLRLNIEQR